MKDSVIVQTGIKSQQPYGWYYIRGHVRWPPLATSMENLLTVWFKSYLVPRTIFNSPLAPSSEQISERFSVIYSKLY